MVRDVLDLRSHNWVPKCEEVKAKTITEIHSEAEKTLGLRPGATASLRNVRNPGVPGDVVPGGIPVARPGAGGLMPGMPGFRRMPSLGDDDWEVPRTHSMPRGGNGSAGRVQPTLLNNTPSPSLASKYLPQGTGALIIGKTSALLKSSDNPPVPTSNVGSVDEPITKSHKPIASVPTTLAPSLEKPLPPITSSDSVELRCKKVSLLEEYFGVRNLDEALQCVEELKSPEYCPEFVKEAVALALRKIPPCVEHLYKLLDFLSSKNVLTTKDIGSGFLFYGSTLDDIAIDLPKAPTNFGKVIGKLVLSMQLDFNAVREVPMKMEEEMLRSTIFHAVKRSVHSKSLGTGLVGNSRS